MITMKFHLNIFLIIFMFSAFTLYGVEITFFDCNGKKLDPKEIEYAKKWNEAAQNVINNQDVIDCLPRNWKNSAETWMKYCKVKIKICRQKLFDPNNCGNLQKEYIVVPEENNSGCGCEEATIFHEFIHQAVPVEENETNDRKIRGCEKLILTKVLVPGKCGKIWTIDICRSTLFTLVTVSLACPLSVIFAGSDCK